MTRNKPEYDDAFADEYVEDMVTLARPEPTVDDHDEQATRSPRQSYLDLAALAPSSSSSSSSTSVFVEEQATRSPRQSFLDLAGYKNDPLEQTRAHEIAPPSSRRSRSDITNIVSVSSLTNSEERTRSPRESYVALDELPSLAGSDRAPISRRSPSPSRPSFADPDSETGFIAAPVVARRSFVATGEMVRDRESDSVTAYAPPAARPSSRRLMTSELQTYSSSEIEEVHEDILEDNLLHTDELPALQHDYVANKSQPLDYEALQRYLFDAPAPAAAPPPPPSQRQPQNALQRPTPVVPMATIRGGFLAQTRHDPLAPTPMPAGAAPSHFAAPQLAQPMPHRSQLARAVDAVRETLAQSIAARESRDTNNNSNDRAGYIARLSSPPSAPPPSSSSGDTTPWIVSTSPSSQRRSVPSIPPMMMLGVLGGGQQRTVSLKTTLTVLVSSFVALLTIGIVLLAVLLVRDDPKSTVVAAATPPPSSTYTFEAQPASALAPATAPSVIVISAAETAAPLPLPLPAAKKIEKTEKPIAVKAPVVTAAPPTPPTTVEKPAAPPAAKTTTKPASPAAPGSKPKSIEQMLDELGEEQLKR